ncbi:hypothetical protein BT96DRAFT_928889 [Gymnopus androsaceus JB14]|uniref:F-box domain-containing protein n=1 Tax=Gymnopus androsaceus JB14 TaxID=1447944 RepID=A0A6A4GJ62_9AGAR|nr:hypothetical protein BT96DRAFT_928889 [Gymnopus androsaceus JB14]
MSIDRILCSQCRNPILKTQRVNIDSLEPFSSELYTKLRSEYGPTVFEYNPPGIQDRLLVFDNELEDYEQEIVCLENQLLYIREQYKRLMDHRMKLSSFFSPCRKLPNETLQSIFDYTCDWNFIQDSCSLDLETTPSSPIPSLPALSISAVCSRWRSVATSTTSLWSRLKLKVPAQRASRAFCGAIELYLQRSQDCPLDIHFIGSPNSHNDSQIDGAILSILIQHSFRWRSFCYDGEWILNVLIPAGVEFNTLETVTTNGGLELEVFEKAPKLWDLCIPRLPPKPSCFPWHQITHLDFRVQDSDIDLELDDVMHSSLNLATLKLCQDRRCHITRLSQPRSFDKLTSLTVGVCHFWDDMGLFEYILSSFTFPSLLELHVYSSTSRHFQPALLEEFRTFISRSSSKITKFSLQNVRIHRSVLQSILHLLPSIEDLTIRNHAYSNVLTSEFFSWLQVQSDIPVTQIQTPIPRLCRLSLEFEGTSFDDAAFINTVSSRWIPDPIYAAEVGVDCLRSVVLKFLSCDVDEEVYAPLWNLDRMGLMAVVTGI